MQPYANGQQIPFRYFDSELVKKRPLVVSFRRIHKMTTNNGCNNDGSGNFSASIATTDIVSICDIHRDTNSSKANLMGMRKLSSKQQVLRQSRVLHSNFIAVPNSSSIFQKSPSAKEMRSIIQLESLYDEKKKFPSVSFCESSSNFERCQTATADKLSGDGIIDNGIYFRSEHLLNSIPDFRKELTEEDEARPGNNKENVIRKSERIPTEIDNQSVEGVKVFKQSRFNQSASEESTFDGLINEPIGERRKQDDELIHQKNGEACREEEDIIFTLDSTGFDKLTDHEISSMECEEEAKKNSSRISAKSEDNDDIANNAVCRKKL